MPFYVHLRERFRPRDCRLSRGCSNRPESCRGLSDPRLGVLEKGQPDRAITDFDRAITLNRPNDWTYVGPLKRRYPELHLARGEALREQGRNSSRAPLRTTTRPSSSAEKTRKSTGPAPMRKPSWAIQKGRRPTTTERPRSEPNQAQRRRLDRHWSTPVDVGTR